MILKEAADNMLGDVVLVLSGPWAADNQLDVCAGVGEGPKSLKGAPYEHE